MNYVKLDIRKDCKNLSKKPANCTECNLFLGRDSYTYSSAFHEESFCSEQCASNHYWKVYASDTYLGII